MASLPYAAPIMNYQLPIRDAARQLEDTSEQFFRASLPPGWTCEKPINDYGVDLRVGVVDGTSVTGMEFLVQLKASHSLRNDNFERIKLKISTYNYLMSAVSVVMLVKYIDVDRDAYWILLRDVPAPNPTHATFTVKIPKGNKLSILNWKGLNSNLDTIHQRKLDAGRTMG